MYGRKNLPLGGWLLVALFGLGVSLCLLLSGTDLLWHGVTTRGVIVAEHDVTCGKSQTKSKDLSVQFTDQQGQTDVGTISQCSYELNASLGDSITIVYLPNSPTVIDTPNGLIANIQENLVFTVLLSLITPVVLTLWIRKRRRLTSLYTPDKLEAQRYAQEFDRKLIESQKNTPSYDN